MPADSATQISVLKKRPEFLTVQGAHKKCVTPGFILQSHRRKRETEAGSARAETGDKAGQSPQNYQNDIRYGITATKRIGKAVQRNRAKRRLREVAKKTLSAYGQPGWDYVFIARQAVISHNFADLIQDAIDCLQKNLEKKPKRTPNRTTTKAAAKNTAKKHHKPS